MEVLLRIWVGHSVKRITGKYTVEAPPSQGIAARELSKMKDLRIRERTVSRLTSRAACMSWRKRWVSRSDSRNCLRPRVCVHQASRLLLCPRFSRVPAGVRACPSTRSPCLWSRRAVRRT